MRYPAFQRAFVLLLVVGAHLTASAYNHPCMPLTNADIDALNANKTSAPWSVGYSKFISGAPWPEPHTKLNYVMKGPFMEVGRNPAVNMYQWRDDMEAIFGLALQWKFTGDAAYAEKAKGILLAWANTHTVWSGVEPYLELGDYMPKITLAASILRSYPGWTAADTTTVKNYFNNVHWNAASPTIPLRSANQGAAHLVNGMAVAVYCDDTTKFNQVVEAFRRNGCTGLLTTQSNGQVGDTGRDQGHACGELLHYAWIAEVAWKAAGVDLFAEAGNRLRAAGEYYANYNSGGSPSFIKAGTCYNLFTSIGGARTPLVDPTFLHLLHGAYVVRKGHSMPFLTAYRDNQTDDWQSWVYRKAFDTSTASSPLPGVVNVVPAAVTGDLTRTDVNGALPAGTSGYANGTWTVTAGGTDLWGGNATDSFTFLHRQVTGDATLVARVTGLGSSNTFAKAGLVLRESLAGDSKMAMIATYPGTGGLATSGRGASAYSHYANSANHANGTVPYWLKIERVGNRVTTFDSANGTDWTPVKSYEFAMSGTYYLGLGVTSRVNGAATTATFTNVSLSSGITNGTYRIRNRANGQYLDNLGKYTDGLDNVSQWPSSYSNNQKWTVTTADGYSKIACVTGGKYLDSVNRTGNDTPVGQWSGGGSPNQQWTIVNLGTGYYKIVNRANGYTLDTGGSTGPTAMEFWAPGNSHNQQWQFEAQ